MKSNIQGSPWACPQPGRHSLPRALIFHQGWPLGPIASYEKSECLFWDAIRHALELSSWSTALWDGSLWGSQLSPCQPSFGQVHMMGNWSFLPSPTWVSLDLLIQCSNGTTAALGNILTTTSRETFHQNHPSECSLTPNPQKLTSLIFVILNC